MTDRIATTIIFAVLLSLGATRALAEPATCLQCHEDKELTAPGPGGQARSMYVDLKIFEASVHGSLDCVDCHQDLQGFEDFPHAEDLKAASCSPCHDDASEAYGKSLHYKISRIEGKVAPNCADCHGTHHILSSQDPKSPTHKARQDVLCGRCHSLKGLKNREVRLPIVLENYARSVHHQAILKGNLKAATCTSCHGTHDLRGAADPESHTNRWNIPRMCGRCHESILEHYTQGIHGKAFALGITESPNCTDCHGEHSILSREDSEAATFNKRISYQLCLDCHLDPKTLRKFGSSLGAPMEFTDSYHGLSLNINSPRSATCVSCHETHRTLPARNPASSVAPGNVVKTCRQCHPGASSEFARSYTPAQANLAENTIARIVRNLYIFLIIATIGGMAVHNILILMYYFRQKHRQEKHKPTLRRFNIQEILQHLLLSITFIGLVITGFALKYSDNFLMQFLASLGMTEPVRSLLHRIFAVGLLVTGAWHVFYLTATADGRRQLSALMLRLQDVRDVILNLRYHLGLTKERPLFARYDYSEKAEYWALIWGTAVMAFTGFVLWFPVFFTSFMPFWIIKVSELIHFYEAILATLAILVWHFFFVILHPEEYPMNLSWLTGRITVDLAEEKYPLWTHEQLQAQAGEASGENPPETK